MGIKDTLKLEQERDALKVANVRLQRQLARAKGKTEDYVDAVRAAALDAAVTVGRPAPVKQPKPDRRKKDVEVAVLHLTDLHFGKRTPTFDSQVAAVRVAEAVAKTIKLTEIQRADHPVDRCVVMLGGDLIENTSIFPGQVWEVSSDVFGQVFTASHAIQTAVLTLLEHFHRVEVYEVWGNHGRIGRKHSGDNPRSDNWDRIVGEIARQNLGDQSRMTWHPTPEIWHAIVSAGAWSALLIHGDSIKSFGGNIPAYGIQRALNKYATGVTAPFVDGFLGHFHTSMEIPIASGGRAWVTPSIESGSAFASEFMGSLGKPAQRLVFVHPGRGRVTSEHLLYLDDHEGAK